MHRSIKLRFIQKNNIPAVNLRKIIALALLLKVKKMQNQPKAKL